MKYEFIKNILINGKNENSSNLIIQEVAVYRNNIENEKIAIFKFLNSSENLINNIMINIEEYDKENRFIKEDKFLFDNVNCPPNSTFIPERKIKIDFNCDYLKVEIIETDNDITTVDNETNLQTKYNYILSKEQFNISYKFVVALAILFIIIFVSLYIGNIATNVISVK